MAYIYQAPKDFDEQSAKVKAKYGDIAGMLNSGEYDLQLKYDGVFSVTHTSSASAETRQQKAQPSAAKLAQTISKIFGTGNLVFKELWNKELTHKQINGMSRRGEVQPLQARIFDMINANEFANGICRVPYLQRYYNLQRKLEQASCEELQIAAVVADQATYKTEKDLIDLALMTQRQTEFGAFDGLILRKRDALWRPGASKDGAVVKIKPVDTLDLKITAQHAEERATKLGGFVTVTYDGVTTDVGGGLTQEDLRGILLWNSGDRSPAAKNFVGKIGEISYLEITEAGRLREPRIARIRHDALPEEEKR